MPLILKDVYLTRPDGRPLIDAANLCFTPGVTALIGPNGSGKSTLLRSIATLHPIASGSIYLDSLNSVRDKVGFLQRLILMPQSFMAYPELTGAEFLEYTLRLRGADSRSAKRLATAWLNLVSLNHAAKERTGTYSQGMLQRLGFAYAMQVDVAVHILDEPFAGVDPETRQLLMELMFDSCMDRIIITSTHHVDEMIERGAKIARLVDGRLMT